MTNAEAIKMLKSKMDGHTDTSYEWAETVRVAIKALEQQTCEDAVSRAEAIKAMNDIEQEDIELYGCHIPEGFDGKRAIEALQSLPSVALSAEPCDVPDINVGDMISRQAAIDALHQYFADGFEEDRWWNSTHVLAALKSLPPVKPQYTEDEIQKMQELEQAEIQKAYEIGKAEKPNKWIPVSERSPFVGIDVLICDIEGTIYLSHRTYLDDYFDECGNKIKDIRAWMPLPQPYEPQERSDEE